MHKKILFAAIAAISLSACTATNVATTVAANLTSATQVQCTTLGDAATIADAVTKSADIYLKAPTTTQAQAQAVLNALTTLHTQLALLRADQAAGKTLVFDAYNAALADFSAIKL